MMSTVGMIYATGDKICATGCNIYTAGVKNFAAGSRLQDCISVYHL